MNETGRTIPHAGSSSEGHARKTEFSVHICACYCLIRFQLRFAFTKDCCGEAARVNRWGTPARTKRGPCHIFIHKILMDPDMHKDLMNNA